MLPSDDQATPDLALNVNPSGAADLVLVTVALVFVARRFNRDDCDLNLAGSAK